MGGSYRRRFGLVLLVDPLVATLAARIDDAYVPAVFAAAPSPAASPAEGGWRQRLPTAKRAAGRLPLASWRGQLARRLEALRGVAAALRHLHDRRIVYRDVKPENIGFHRRERDGVEVPKLFDFGLAKELKPKLLDAHPHHVGGRREDTYQLTARSGSPRYMAPEVAFATPYNEKADVYSFGMTLYQTASLVTPFEGYSWRRLEREVLCDMDRPDVRIPTGRRALAKVAKVAGRSHAEWRAQPDDARQARQLGACAKCVWPRGLRGLIEECWHDDMRQRPSARDVVARLEDCLEELLSSEGGVREPWPEAPRKSSTKDAARVGIPEGGHRTAGPLPRLARAAATAA